MARSGVPRGEGHALQQMLGTQQDQISQLFRLVPGKAGGGSVAAPFTIGGLTLDDATIAKLAALLTPTFQEFDARFDQGVTTNLGRTKIWDEFVIVGELVHWTFNYGDFVTGTAGSALYMTMPVAPYRTSGSMELGNVLIYDSSATTRYNTLGETSTVTINSAPVMAFGAEAASGALWGASPSVAIGASDTIRGNLTYRMAAS